jgi:alkylhydroperoxidase family enzyme
MARKAGVTERQIETLQSWKTSANFDEREKAALALGEAVTEGRVSDEVYTLAKKHFDDHDYVEIALVAAFYAMVARMIDAMDVELDQDVKNYSPKLP